MSPRIEDLPRILASEWRGDAHSLLGFVHSHPKHARSPSRSDIQFIGLVMNIVATDRLYLPIATVDGGFELFSFVVARAHRNDLTLERCELRVVD